VTLLWADCSLTRPSALFSPAGNPDGENGAKIPPPINSTILFSRTRKKALCYAFAHLQSSIQVLYLKPNAAVNDTLLKGRVPQDGYFFEVLQKWALS
jgi:hypothetical protein